MTGNADLIEAFRAQSRACGKLGSPFMAALLNEAAGEMEHAGSISGLLASWPGHPVADAVPLRLAAALHALVLSDAAPELAALYPGAAQDAEAAAACRCGRALRLAAAGAACGQRPRRRPARAAPDALARWSRAMPRAGAHARPAGDLA